MRVMKKTLLAAAAAWFLVSGAAPAANSARAERRVQFTLTVQNPTTRSLADQRVAFYVPARDTASQELLDVDVNVPHHMSQDGAGNTIVELDFPTFPAYATQVVRITSRLAMRAQPKRQRLKQKALFLGEEPYIESDQTPIRTLATKLKRGDDTATARATYEWVRGNLHYAGYVAPDLGAAYAIRELRGDCTEYAYLTAALARANGIPARVMGGYVSNVDFAPRAVDYHNWTELYVGGAWLVVDAQKETFADHGADYVATRIISSRAPNQLEGNHRFRVIGEVVVLVE